MKEEKNKHWFDDDDDHNAEVINPVVTSNVKQPSVEPQQVKNYCCWIKFFFNSLMLAEQHFKQSNEEIVRS
jgi:hypothetical protein